MAVSSDFQVYVSSHSFNESFLYNNRMLSGRFITAEQYNLNRDYVLARRAEQGR